MAISRNPLVANHGLNLRKIAIAIWRVSVKLVTGEVNNPAQRGLFVAFEQGQNLVSVVLGCSPQ
jgi:hypothetical protein